MIDAIFEMLNDGVIDVSHVDDKGQFYLKVSDE